MARRNSRGAVPLMRLNNRLKCEISRKPAVKAISATFLFRGLSSKSRVQAAIRLSLTRGRATADRHGVARIDPADPLSNRASRASKQLVRSEQ